MPTRVGMRRRDWGKLQMRLRGSDRPHSQFIFYPGNGTFDNERRPYLLASKAKEWAGFCYITRQQ